jgi:dimethylaniline monooxygenase (N-oxide forming)
MSVNRVAIIGAGPSGLVSAKSALECGLEPTVFEKGGTIGGLWKPNGSTWEGLQTNLSRFSCMFSDFSWDRNIQLFPNQSEVYEYLKRYVTHYELASYIHCHSEVRHIRKQGNQWLVKWVEGESKEKRVFDAIIIATGIFSESYIPEVKGMEKFSGTILHSQAYRNRLPFQNKKVAVIGSAYSGTEIAADVAQVANKTLHLVRHVNWILPKYIPMTPSGKLLPLDFIFYGRAKKAAMEALSLTSEEANERKHKFCKQLSNQDTVDPALAIPISSHPVFVTISDTYLGQVEERRIEIRRSQISSLNEHGCNLEDGSYEEVDALIFCTGFRANLSFLDPAILDSIGFQQEDALQPLLLYKCTWHPELANMAFVGMYRGPFFAVMELQARWACQVFKGITQMPPHEKMVLGIAEEKSIRERKPRPQFPHDDYQQMANELAREIGVLPPLQRLQETDPTLYQQVWDGPYVPAHFRVTGFGSKPELAREMIKEAMQDYLSFQM